VSARTSKIFEATRSSSPGKWRRSPAWSTSTPSLEAGNPNTGCLRPQRLASLGLTWASSRRRFEAGSGCSAHRYKEATARSKSASATRRPTAIARRRPEPRAPRAERRNRSGFSPSRSHARPRSRGDPIACSSRGRPSSRSNLRIEASGRRFGTSKTPSGAGPAGRGDNGDCRRTARCSGPSRASGCDGARDFPSFIRHGGDFESFIHPFIVLFNDPARSSASPRVLLVTGSRSR